MNVTRHGWHKSLGDAKPTPRVKDRNVFRRFHEAKPRCLSCGDSHRVQAHHLLARSQRGDDVLANLVPLCWLCHGALHGQNDADVRLALGHWILSAEGVDAAMYLTAKLGVDASRAFVERLGVGIT